MSTDSEGFDLASRDDAEERLAPTPKSPTPKPGAGVHHPAEGRTGAPAPAAGRAAGHTARRKAGRKTAAAKSEGAPADPKTGLPFPFRPGFLLVFGAAVLAILWAGGLFGGSSGPGAWPWAMFQTDGGAVTFTWDAAHVYTVLGAFFVVFFLLAPLGPAVRSRGAAVLTVAALGLVTFPMLTHLDRTVGLMGLAAGAIFAREGLHGGSGGRAFLFVMVLLLGAALLLPFPTAPADPGYQSEAQDLFQSLFGGDEAFGDVILEPGTAAVLMAVVLLVVGVLGWLGIGGRWSLWVAGVALLVGVLGPMALAWRSHAAATDAVTCADSLQAIVGGLPARLLAFALPAAAGALDASRP